MWHRRTHSKGILTRRIFPMRLAGTVVAYIIIIKLHFFIMLLWGSCLSDLPLLHPRAPHSSWAACQRPVNDAISSIQWHHQVRHGDRCDVLISGACQRPMFGPALFVLFPSPTSRIYISPIYHFTFIIIAFISTTLLMSDYYRIVCAAFLQVAPPSALTLLYSTKRSVERQCL